jgi:hypothetical protein
MFFRLYSRMQSLEEALLYPNIVINGQVPRRISIFLQRRHEKCSKNGDKPFRQLFCWPIRRAAISTFTFLSGFLQRPAFQQAYYTPPPPRPQVEQTDRGGGGSGQTCIIDAEYATDVLNEELIQNWMRYVQIDKIDRRSRVKRTVVRNKRQI